jgi:two-component system, chemotaxis family, chemotaxis protein CheY
MALNMLIVDDSATTRAVIRKTLGLTGVPLGEIHEAANGEEGLKKLHDHWIDLVFADINMPVMNGVEFVSRKNSDPTHKTIPVVIVSTDNSQARIEQLKGHGVESFVRKPFTPEELKKNIVTLLGVTQ